MPMKVEAAIVTQKRPEASFNTDSVNVNGKVFPRDVIKNGYKGSGIISGSVFFALTSSDVDGFADAAVTAFNERAEIFPVVRDARTVFSGFYEDCRSALLNMKRNENDLRCACFYASGRKAVLAGNGGVKLYLHRLNNCTPVTPEKVIDTVADYGSSIFPDVNVGDIFILMSPGTAEVISEKEIDDICKISDGSVKRIINYITKVGLAKDGTKAISAIAVKILDTAPEDELSATGFVPDFSEIEKKPENATEAADDTRADETEQSEEVTEENSKNNEETASETDENNAEAVPVVPEEEISENEKEEAVDFETVAEALALAQETVAFESEELPESAETAKEASPEEETQELSEEEKAAKAYKRTRIMLFSILGVLIVISIALLAVIIAGDGFSLRAPNEPKTEETTDEETSAEETSAEETTEEETTEEETAEEETTGEEAATAEEETTRRAQPAVTPVTPSVSTTVAPRPSETTTAVSSETTTEAIEDTTEAPSEEASSEEAENTEAQESQTQEDVSSEQSSSEESPEANPEASSVSSESTETASSETAE